MDEGKFSLLLVHLLNHTKNKMLVQGLLLERKQQGLMSFEAKTVMLEQLKEYGNLEYVKGVAKSLEIKLEEEIGRIEELTGKKNWILGLLVAGLQF